MTSNTGMKAQQIPRLQEQLSCHPLTQAMTHHLSQSLHHLLTRFVTHHASYALPCHPFWARKLSPPAEDSMLQDHLVILAMAEGTVVDQSRRAACGDEDASSGVVAKKGDTANDIWTKYT